MDRKALLFPCGLILASSYLSTASPVGYSFAFDKPLHTAGVVLLLTGLVIVACEAWSRQTSQPRLPTRYVAIPLSDGHSRPHREEIWNEAGQPAQKRAWGVRTVGALLAILLFAICGRIGVFYYVVKNVECSGPSHVAFLPLVLALYHSIRHSSQRYGSVWTANTRPLTYCELMVDFVYNNSTRYILPSVLLSISSFLVIVKSTSLRSTYICPIAEDLTTAISFLQFLGFVLDSIIVPLLYRLVDDDISPADDWTIRFQDGTSNNMLAGFTFTASALVLLVAGLTVYVVMPEHRQLMFAFPSEYLHGLLRLSLMIPFITLCFLKSARLYGVMSSVLIVAFSSAFIGVLRSLGTDVSHSFPPKSTISLVPCLALLIITLVLYLIVHANIETRARSTISARFGRNQTVAFVLILIGFSVSVIVYHHQKPLLEHPITTLIELANVQHDQWASQAHRSKSLAEAVVHYRQRYTRDPPPGFDKWYEFAVLRSSIVIDDYDNVEEDLAPFSSFNPDDLRLRTATVLATHEGTGGIRIRAGVAEAFVNASEPRWLPIDGALKMIRQFAVFLPDMDLALNLNDGCRVAIPHDRLRDALDNPQPYPASDPSRASKDFSKDRASKWPNVDKIHVDPQFFEDARHKPSYQTYGSIACPPNSRARKERHWDTQSLCPTCALPHSMGAFVSNWTLSGDPCHQPDIANLHSLHLSPSALMGTHDIVPVFSHSRAPGYADIRYPSPWTYMEKTKYEFDEKFPDSNFHDKEDVLFWRGAISEGVSISGSWKGMLRQRLVHLLNNNTSRQPVLLPKGDHSGQLEYMLEHTDNIKKSLGTKTDVRFVENITHCAGQICKNQAREFGLVDRIDFKQHWRYRYLFDMDGPSSSTSTIPFLQSNSVVFKTAGVFREWFDGRLTAWHHFVPVDIRLHDIFSILAYFGGWGVEARTKRMTEGRTKEAQSIARQGRVWADKVLRKEDAEVYMFRLLLEWGRLTDDARVDVGFRMGRRNGKDRGKAERAEL
ncbi:glycosyltransferase family 90 protein [Dothidotthia symphoricarpi CBS 119687]|uniref:Glycosyltransferase family 90 protein n=1 Tax=Dothidotthia symphoricarpi CBS 119687 TaxID=1392245 RepID=A0A6A5ZYU0_9PLEO|nr:glycosyltransferase family 90 protein [Dothidotthia symphoricarpi CBS 119687]KAF2124912.1 glycosyltransferase family 90 protein [Dothidotthia symphoricarpi CBS 119687]